MSLRLSRCFKGGLAIAALVWGGLGVPAVLAQPQPALEAEATTAQPRTNTIPSTARSSFVPKRAPLPRNGLLRLEEQLDHAFAFLKPNGSSLDALPTAPMAVHSAPVVPSRRALELMDQKKNWMFMNPDDLTAAPKPEDMFGLPDLGGDKSLSTVERFYQNLDRRKGSNKKNDPLAAAEDLRRMHDEFNKSQDPEMVDPNEPVEIRNKEKELKRLLGLDTTSSTAHSASTASSSSRGTLTDIFGFGDRQATPEEEQAQKDYIKSYSAWLNGSSAAAQSGSGIALPPGATDPTRPTVYSSSSPATFTPYNPAGRPDNYDPSIGMVNPTLATTAPQDITTKVLNQWNPYYTPPKVEAPKYTPPEPVFDVPRRKF